VDAALDAAVRRRRIDARTRRPALAVDLQLGLVRLVPGEMELLKARLEAELAKESAIASAA
jgi:hypothetical protein